MSGTRLVYPMLQRRSVANFSNTASVAEIRIFNQVHGQALSFARLVVVLHVYVSNVHV